MTDIAFSTDDRTLITTSRDGMVQRWDTGALLDLLADPTRTACALSGSGLGQQDWATYVINEPYRETCP